VGPPRVGGAGGDAARNRFRDRDGTGAACTLADYRDAVQRANEVIEACADLSLPAPRAPHRKSAPSMRWVLVHLIEETGRHAGHADIVRQQIDGSTGR
jgi:hypothetical protein